MNDIAQHPGQDNQGIIRIPVYDEELLNTRSLGVMPAVIVFVRHGESQANVINGKLKRGEITEYPQGFADIPDREIRLSEKGIEQANAKRRNYY